MNLSRAMEELENFAGRQFDPQLVKLVSKSASIRRLLGIDRTTPEPTPQTSRVSRPAWAQRIAQ
jgi:HD-GYP domain-containing protein (c-di-GMP phosphodiesterase class II)